jgi:glycosyltransferase involved in cell wall biosynthesis
MNNPIYIVVTPVKNEEAYIAFTVHSMQNQVNKPLRWVIVNDGSTDGTEGILRKLCGGTDWIDIVNHVPERQEERKRGSKIVRAFYAGYETVRQLPHDFVVKLDGDISFEPEFFKELLTEEFGRRPRLGISSGVSYIPDAVGGWVEEKSAKGHTLGATKVYRKRCFEEIGGLVPYIGWDGIDEIKARMLGWDAECRPDLIVRHYRPEGTASGKLSAYYEDGEGAYFMGYHPFFMVCRGIIRMRSYPYVVGGLSMLYAYFKCYINKMERINDMPFVQFLRREQIKKLMLRKSLV